MTNIVFFNMASTGTNVQKLSGFKNKSVEYVAEWLDRNKLRKLKPVFEGSFNIC